MGRGSLIAALVLAPLLAGQDEVGFESELGAALSDHVAALDELGGWCASKKLFAERAAVLEEILIFEPNHRDARRLLGHRRERDGGWIVPANQRPARNLAKKHLDECVERHAELSETFAERLFGVVAFYERADSPGSPSPARKAEAYEWILTVFPDHAGVRAFRGEARTSAGWVLAESARAKLRRPELKTIVREALAAVPELVEVQPTELERALGVHWSAAVGTPRVRVLGSVPRDELERVARTAHATFEVYAAVFDDPVRQLEDYTIYVLSGESERDAFIRGWPGWGPDRLAEIRAWAGAGVPEDIHVARWDASPARRLDGAMRHTLGLCMKLDTGAGLDVAWAWEGFGMYLSRAMVGTRLTWYGSGLSAATTGSRSKQLLGRLLNADVNWMNEAYSMLKADAAPKLATLLERDINAMGVRDVLLAYAFAAYLLEGCPDAVPGLLAAAGEDRARSSEAVTAALGRELHETQDRLQRWLSERR